MKPALFLYAPPGRGYDPRQQDQPAYGRPVYYQPVYYPYPSYYGPPVNPYEAARQGESADRIASIIWKLVLVLVVSAVVGVLGFIAWVSS